MKVNIGPYTDDGQDIDIHIDDYDVWGMDFTLSKIILPMLVILKKNKHGAPHVDDEDLPLEMRQTEKEIALMAKNDGAVIDELFFPRWDWIMDEMIWSFDFLANDRESEILDRIYKDDPEDESIQEMLDSGRQYDYSELYAAEKRAGNGYRLFGKYYRNLWD